MTELTLNKHFIVTLPPTNETIMKHTFNLIKHGGNYRFVIATDVDNAIPSQPIIYVAPDISPPHQLTVLHENQDYVIFWQEHDLPESLKSASYHYEILVVEGSNRMNESIAKVYETEQPPYTYKDVKPDVIYTFAVRLVTDEGYKSPLSEILSTRTSLAGIYLIV